METAGENLITKYKLIKYDIQLKMVQFYNRMQTSLRAANSIKIDKFRCVPNSNSQSVPFPNYFKYGRRNENGQTSIDPNSPANGGATRCVLHFDIDIFTGIFVLLSAG